MRESRVFAVLVAIVACACACWMSFSRTAKTETVTLPDPSDYAPNYVYDGVILAPSTMKANEESSILSNLLGVGIAKFAAKTTKPNLMVTYNLELREKGKLVKRLDSHKMGPFGGDPKPGLSSLYVAILPLNGSLSEADKIKVFLTSGGTSSASILDNPFKGAMSYGSPNPQPIYLSGAHALL
jgi:hypothetical protein